MSALDKCLVIEPIRTEILSYLKMSDLESCRLVSTGWRNSVDETIKSNSSFYSKLQEEMSEEVMRLPWNQLKKIVLPAYKHFMDLRHVTVDSQHIYASEQLGEGLFKLDLKTGKILEYVNFCDSTYIWNCGDFILGNKYFFKTTGHHLFHKQNLIENSLHDDRFILIKAQMDQMKIAPGANREGIWALKEIGTEIEVFFLSSIAEGFQMKGRIQKSNGCSKKSWVLDGFKNFTDGFVCALNDGTQKQFVFVTSPELVVVKRIFSSIRDEMYLTTMSLHVVILETKLETEGAYCIYNARGEMIEKVYKEDWYLRSGICGSKLVFEKKWNRKKDDKNVVVDTRLKTSTIWNIPYDYIYLKTVGKHLIFLKRWDTDTPRGPGEYYYASEDDRTFRIINYKGYKGRTAMASIFKGEVYDYGEELTHKVILEDEELNEICMVFFPKFKGYMVIN